MMTSTKTSKIIARLASDKKAEDILILDMRKVVNFCDYFVICSGNTDRHVKAIAEGIDEGLEEAGLDIYSKQGMNRCDWIVFDTGDVVTHIFQKDLRDFYRLEYLWQEAKIIDFKA